MTDRDPGLQRERTAMAWTRTGLAILVNALVVVRAGAQTGHMLILGAGGFLLAASAAAVGCGFWRGRRLATGADPTTPWPLVMATMAIAWFACAAVIATIVTTRA